MTYDEYARSGLILAERVRSFVDPRLLRRDIEHGRLVRIRRGAYVGADRWNASTPREKHVFLIRAVLAVSPRATVIAGESAAALWGMPIAGPWPDYVTVLAPWAGGGRSGYGVRRITAERSTAATAEVRGITVTDQPRTCFDIARHLDFAVAIGSVDWLLSPRNPAPITTVHLRDALEAMNPRSGGQHLRRLVEFATPLSGSFGESEARAAMHLLGFAAPQLQREFRDDVGTMVVDFYWPGVKRVVEFDGKVKYTREIYTKGDPNQVAWAEKKREDRLVRLGVGVTRILTEHVKKPNVLERILLESGIPRA